MRPLSLYVSGLGLAHLLFALFYLLGCLGSAKSRYGRPTTSLLADLVITTTNGIAIAGFTVLLLGTAHLLNSGAIALTFLSEALLSVWVNRSSLRAIIADFVGAWSLPAVLVYVTLLVLALPAILPAAMSDDVTYHLAYAADWANAHRIYVNPYLRFPYYANGFLPLHAALMTFHLDAIFCQFLTWLCGLLTCLGVMSFMEPSQSEVDSGDRRAFRWLIQFITGIGLAFCPIFFRYLDNGYIDIPICLFLLVPVLCAWRVEERERYLWPFVLVAGFCAGMKITLVGHLPFFLVLLLIMAKGRASKQQTVKLCLALLALSSPWYLRNLVLIGDPMPPTVSVLLHKQDPIFSAADIAGLAKDTAPDRRFTSVLLAPVHYFIEATGNRFREYGVGAAIMLLYLQPIIIAAWLLRRSASLKQITFLSAVLIYCSVPWLLVSSLGRYSLHWYPLLIAWTGVAALASYDAARTWSGLRWKSMAFCTLTAATLVLMWPTPATSTLLWKSTYDNVRSLNSKKKVQTAYLRHYLNGYEAFRAVNQLFHRNGTSDRNVMVFHDLRLTYYFAKEGIQVAGDFFGPARYSELFRQVKEGDGKDYLTKHKVSAVILNSSPTHQPVPPYLEALDKRLIELGFRKYQNPDDDSQLFLGPDISETPGDGWSIATAGS